MDSTESNRIAAFLTRRFEHSTDAVEIAQSMVSVWEEIDAVLRPIIGQRGVAGLFRRSTYVAGRLYPWLIDGFKSPPTTIDLAALKTALEQQNPADAIGAASLLLQTFYELLANLIGPSLTERLLRVVWANFYSGLAAQDATP